MIYKNSFLGALVIVASMMSIGYCADEPRNQERGETEMVMGKNEDSVVHAECINTSAGLTVGFRIEIINPSTDKNLVLVVRDNISFLFNVRLINEEGVDISPRLPKIAKDKRGPTSPKKYRYERITPGASYVWFIPVPHQVRIDHRKFTNDNNLHMTPKGEYMTEIKVSFSYFTQDKGIKLIPEYPEFQQLRLTLPHISIAVDPKFFDQDIEKIYQEQTKRKSRGK